MSQQALLQAVRNHLISQLTLGNDQCDIMPEGRPIPGMGQFFYAVDDGGVEVANTEFLSERYSVDVTVTVRTGQFPSDRRRLLVVTATSGIDARCDAIKSKLHGSYTVMDAANVLITGSVNKFQRPLRLMSISAASYRGADWAGSANDNDCFVTRTLRFGDALRVQDLDIMT